MAGELLAGELLAGEPLEAAVPLRRRLGLALLMLYGITVGAGIHVLIGAVAGHAGIIPARRQPYGGA